MGCHAGNYTHPHSGVNTDTYLTGDYSESHNRPMDFAAWLQLEMDRQGLKQQPLSDMTIEAGEPVTQATISRIVNRKQETSFSNAVALARALGHTADAFMRQQESAPQLSEMEQEVIDLMRQTTQRGRVEVALFARQTVERYPRTDTNGKAFGSSQDPKAA